MPNSTLRSNLLVAGRGALSPSSITRAPDSSKVSRLPADAIPFDRDIADVWPIRDQQTDPTCIAYATTACMEFMLQRRNTGKFPQLSARFLYQQMGQYDPGKPAEGAELGFRKLSQALAVVHNEGVCSIGMWPDNGNLAAAPDDAAMVDAQKCKANEADNGYWDYEATKTRLPDLTQRIYTYLHAGLPVAIALPAFNKSADVNQPTNWSTGDVVASGHVAYPAQDDQPVPASGHAICIVGFEPSDAEPLGGYFIFRNSIGYRFATNGPQSTSTPPPTVPARGYGTISASHVQDHCWEMLCLTLTPLAGPVT